MAGHRVFDHRAQIIPILALRENAVTESARPQAAFLGLAHFKNDFTHARNLAQKIDFDKGEPRAGLSGRGQNLLRTDRTRRGKEDQGAAGELAETNESYSGKTCGVSYRLSQCLLNFSDYPQPMNNN